MELDWSDILETFEAQSSEGLATMEGLLLDLESHPEGDTERLQTIFRICHTLKGDAASLGLSKISEMAHALEDLLDGLRSGAFGVTTDIVSMLLASVDALRGLQEAASEGVDEATPEASRLLERIRERVAAEGGSPSSRAPEPIPAPAGGIQRPHAEHPTLRVRIDTLDRMMGLTGELAIARSRMRALMAAAPAGLATELLDAHTSMDRLFAELQQEVMKVRMIPVGPLFQQQVRSVRDLALAHRKQARVEVVGEEAELDTTVMEHLRDALTHAVRNAVDHGIESPERRTAQGKDPCGTITLAAHHEGSSIVVHVADDGAGLDRERIRARAAQLGLAAHSKELTDAELAQLVFEPDFSTEEAATLTSGRGVGMDVVRRSVEKVGGSVFLTSTPGQGTVLSARFPLTLAIIDGFAIGVGQEIYLMPLGVVVECLNPPRDDLGTGGTSGVMELRGHPLPYVRLADLLGLPPSGCARETIVVVEEEGRLTGIAVDAVYGERHAVIKPLGPHLRRLPGLSGSTILGDGRVALILDTGDLLRRAAAGAQASISITSAAS